MKHFTRYALLSALFLLPLFAGRSIRAQAIKTNIPLILTGNPNIGFEWSVGRQMTINADALWSPYLFKKHEEVFRTLIGSVDFRYYINPRYYYTNDLWDGFYVGPYAMTGNFNIGLKRKDETKTSYRHKGWGVSSGITSRFRIDVNLGVGYAHLQYDKFQLGGEFADFPLEIKQTKEYVGPTKVGAHIIYNIFK